MGLQNRLRGWVAASASRVIADPRVYESVVGVLGRAQRSRELVDELQSAAWHLSGLPSRRDVHRLFRRTASISRRLVELEQAITRLERAAARLDEAEAQNESSSA